MAFALDQRAIRRQDHPWLVTGRISWITAATSTRPSISSTTATTTRSGRRTLSTFPASARALIFGRANASSSGIATERQRLGAGASPRDGAAGQPHTGGDPKLCTGSVSLRQRSIANSPPRDLFHVAHSISSRSRLVCSKGAAKDFEQSCFAFTAGSAKGINRRADLDIDKTTLLKQMPPTCTRQAADNSVSPQVDITQRPR
jgi:hypothetical protein